MLLINNEAVQFNDANFDRHAPERVLKQRILQKLVPEMLEVRANGADLGIVGPARLIFFEQADNIVGRRPFLDKRAAFQGPAIHYLFFDKIKELFERGTAKQIHIFVHRAPVCFAGHGAFNFYGDRRSVHIPDLWHGVQALACRVQPKAGLQTSPFVQSPCGLKAELHSCTEAGMEFRLQPVQSQCSLKAVLKQAWSSGFSLYRASAA